MKYTLHGFEIHGVDGFTNANYKIEVNGNVIEFDEQLLRENEEDIKLLHAIDSFIKSKEVK